MNDAKIDPDETLQETYAACQDVRWMMWLAVRRCPQWWTRAQVGLAACALIKAVLPVFEARYPEDKRPHQAIKVTFAYWRGEATLKEVRMARDEAAAATEAAAEAAEAAADAAAADAYAAFVAAYGAYAATAYADVDYGAADAADAAADAADDAADAAATVGGAIPLADILRRALPLPAKEHA